MCENCSKAHQQNSTNISNGRDVNIEEGNLHANNDHTRDSHDPSVPTMVETHEARRTVQNLAKQSSRTPSHHTSLSSDINNINMQSTGLDNNEIYAPD